MAAKAARALTAGPAHHFFGYYDKCPWDATRRYVLGMEAAFMDRPPRADDTLVLGLIDTASNNAWKALDRTTAWCWQQGTMFQWLGPGQDRQVVYNTRLDTGYAGRILDVYTGEQRDLPRPVYAVSRDGLRAVSVNFARLGVTRPGYGYNGLPDPWEGNLAPEEDGVYGIDLEAGSARLLISLAQIAAIRPQASMAGCKHWINHLQFNADGTRFLFLHRWTAADGRRHTRLFTSDPEGQDVRCVLDHGMTSHFDWRNEHQIFAWARWRDIGDRYFLMEDRDISRVESGTPIEDRDADIGRACAYPGVRIVGEGTLTEDGHCSFGPDGRWLLTDTYPDREESKRTLILYDLQENRRVDVGRYWAIPEITGEFRCDLHPRWSRDGAQVCFDSIHEGSRQIYVVEVADLMY